MTTEIAKRLQQHFATCPRRTYAKGDTIFAAGEDPDVVSFVESGIVQAVALTPEGAELVVTSFKAGSFFPMAWAVNHTPNNYNYYTYSARTEVVVRQEPPATTIAFVRANPDILYDLLQRVFRGTDGIIRRLVLGLGSASKKRLMFELVIEARRFGTPVGEEQQQITIRQSELAARTGLARETISRELKNLEDGGYILRHKRGMVVHIARIEQALHPKT